MQIGSHGFQQGQSPIYDNSLSSQSIQHQSYLAKTGDISITTDEGDVVTFSQSSLAAFEMSSESFATPLATGSTFTTKAIMAESMSFTVDGDLNEQELADIAGLYESLTTIASDFFNGDYGKAMVGAMSLGDLGSLAALDASFTQTQVTATQITSYHAIPDNGDDFTNRFKNRTFPETPKQIPEQDLLAARWTQISEYLDKQQELMQTQEQQEMGRQRYQNHAQEMMEQATKNIQRSPRLSPFTIPIAERAIQEATVESDRSPLQTLNQKQFLKNDFFKQYQNWLEA